MLKEKIVDALCEVYDPEIPINVYDLGLIYDISINPNNEAHVLMTFTSPTCPTAEYLENMVKEAVEGVEGVKSASVEITFDPPWSPDRVSSEAKEELGLDSSPQEDLAVKKVYSDSPSVEELMKRIEKLEKRVEELEKK